MKNNRIIFLLAAFIIMTATFFMPAMAYASEIDKQPITTSRIPATTKPPETSETIKITETENPEPSESTTESAIPDNSKPFTPDGQATVLDLAYESDGKMFYTFKTPAGNVFYLIIDRQRNSDNVYFLNAVTEADLLALAEKSDGKSGVSAIPTTEPTTAESTSDITGKKPDTASVESVPLKQKSSNTGMIVFIVIGVLAVGGVAYYMKIVRPKQQAGMDDEDDDIPNEGDDKEVEFENESEEDTDEDEDSDNSDEDDE